MKSLAETAGRTVNGLAGEPGIIPGLGWRAPPFVDRGLLAGP